ncbi:MAG: hypothetical protein GX288_08440 [Clostridiales bacterium]|nr:hypothetical protein [Clostridiales bacterium]
MNDCELISYITAVACAMIKCLPDDDLELLSAALTQLADTLATYLTQKSIKESKTQDDNDYKCNNNHEKDTVF